MCDHDVWVLPAGDGRHGQGTRETTVIKTDDLAKAIVDAIPMSGCLVDQRGRIIAVSDEWRRFGQENGSLDERYGIGSNYVDLCGASSDAAIRAIGRGVREVLEGHREDFRHVYSCHAPWEVRWYRVICRHVSAEDQRLALVLHNSVTGEVLKGSMLKEVERESERIGRQRGELLQRLSDELRAPLNTVIGLADMLSQAVFGPLGNARYEDYAAEIGTTGRRLRQLVDDVIELSLMEQGALPLREEAVDVAALCERAVADLQEDAAERSVSLLAWAAGPLPRLMADPERVRQMIGHLVCNAIAVSPDGERVTVEAAEDAAGCLTITVTDVGPGLRRDEMAHLTEPFYKVSGPAVDPEHPGLGLALTRGLMEAHGGRLILRARPSRGAAVTLRFPSSRTVTGQD